MSDNLVHQTHSGQIHVRMPHVMVNPLPVGRPGDHDDNGAVMPASGPAAKATMAALLARRSLCKTGIRKIAADETLWCEGDERTHVFIVRSGAVCFSRMLPDGRRIVLGFAYPGDVIGLGCARYQADAVTVQATRLEAIAATLITRAISEDPHLKTCAVEEENRALDAAYQHVVVISKMTATERLASFLIAISNRNERVGLSPLSIVLPMKRIDIADYLGLTIETVSRTFTQFKTNGLIALEQSSIVTFKDIGKLRAMAVAE